MANPHIGQVELVVGDKSYTLQLSPNALVCLKKQTGMGFRAVTAAMEAMGDDPDFELVSAILWASMQDHHPDLTVAQASGLYPAGGLEELVEKIQQVFIAAFPKQSAKLAEKEAAENPPKAATK